MENIQLSNHAELLLRIEELKARKHSQEEVLKEKFQLITSSIDLLSLFKGGSMNKNPEFDIVKVGLNTGVNLIIDLVLGKNRSIKGFLSSVLVEKFTSILINNNLMTIISGVQNLIQRFTSKKDHTNIT